jgi:uncharacterized protein YecT (DUF1311 family)
MRLLIVLAFLGMADLAHATDWDLPPAAIDKACPGAGADVQITDCAIKAAENADKQLNEVWKQALANVGKDSTLSADQIAKWKQDLIDAHESWVAFKDKDCNDVRASEHAGSGSTLAVASCLYEYTTTRTNDLKARYLDEE